METGFCEEEEESPKEDSEEKEEEASEEEVISEEPPSEGFGPQEASSAIPERAKISFLVFIFISPPKPLRCYPVNYTGYPRF